LAKTKLMLKFFLVLLNFSSLLLFSQVSNLSSIPENVLEDANAVILDKQIHIDLQSQSKLVKQVTNRVIVFNKQADDFSNIAIDYDKNTKITSIKLRFLNLLGQVIKEVSKSDFEDYAASGYSTLYSDSRVLNYTYTPTVYPYIMELSYKIKSAQTAFITPWYAYPGYGVGVVKSEYVFTYPKDFKVYKIEKNLDTYNIVKTQNLNTLSYVAKNLSPLKSEPYSPSFTDITPYVRLSVNKFELAGVMGTVNSWDDFGRWMSAELLKGKDELPDAVIENVKKLVKGVDDPIEKAKIIYDYVQRKTRYINVAIGIGGWQPMPANEVEKLGYGDCKALTNYTKTLLDIVGVPAIYTIAYADQVPKDIDKKLIGVQGNHVFLCLPQKQDSIWLECTSQKLPFGFVNSFTDNRDVLAISNTGSKLIHTKALRPEDNFQQTKAQYQILPNGNMEATVFIKSYGNQYNVHLDNFDGLSFEELEKKYANFLSDLQSVNFDKLNVKNNKEEFSFEEHIKLSAVNYATKLSDTAMIFRANPFNRITYVPPKIKEKKYKFIINRGFKDEEFYTVKIPDNYILKKLPKKVQLESIFGNYTVEYIPKGNKEFVYHRIIILNQGEFPKNTYNEYRKFRKKIKKLEKQKVIIYKNN